VSSHGTVSLLGADEVPDGEARYPSLDANGSPQTLPAQVIFEGPGGSCVLAHTRVIPPNQGGMVQVSQDSLARLGGAGQLTVRWRAARFTDLLRYSPPSRRRVIGAALSLVTAVLAAVTAGLDAARHNTSWVVVSLLLAAGLTLAKECLDVWGDWRSVRGK
jgi:hypothetical protein